MTKSPDKSLNKIFTVMLDSITIDLIEEESEHIGSSKGYVVRQALKEYFKNKKKSK